MAQPLEQERSRDRHSKQQIAWDIYFECRYCGKSLVVEVVGAGVKVPCPSCRRRITIPKARPVRDAHGTLSKWLVNWVVGTKPSGNRVRFRVDNVTSEFNGGIHDLRALRDKLAVNLPAPRVSLYIPIYRLWEPLCKEDTDRLVAAYERYWYS